MILKTAVIQRQHYYKKSDNLAALEVLIKEAAKQKATFIVLSELCSSIYFPYKIDNSFFDLAESLDGETASYLIKLSANLNITILASIFEKRTAGIYHNTALVLEDGIYKGHYRKMHLPNDPLFYEKFYFTPGDSDGFKTINTKYFKLGTLICFDQWFMESSRLMALDGADILAFPTAIGFDNSESKQEQKRQFEAWQNIHFAHAIANALPVVVANRSGYDENGGDIDHWGHSFMLSAGGKILAQAKNQESILYADIDLKEREELLKIWSFFRDRRPESYIDLTKRSLI